MSDLRGLPPFRPFARAASAFAADVACPPFRPSATACGFLATGGTEIAHVVEAQCVVAAGRRGRGVQRRMNFRTGTARLARVHRHVGTMPLGVRVGDGVTAAAGAHGRSSHVQTVNLSGWEYKRNRGGGVR